MSFMDILKALLVIGGIVGGVYFAEDRYESKAEAMKHADGDKEQFTAIGTKIDTQRLWGDKGRLELQKADLEKSIRDSMTRQKYGLLDKPGQVTLAMDEQSLASIIGEINEKTTEIDRKEGKKP